MYAYEDGKRAVVVGVYFCYMLPDNGRQVFGVPFQDAVLEQLHDRGGVHAPPFLGPQGYNVFQFGLPGAQPVHFLIQFGDRDAGQDRLHAVRDLRGDLEQFRLFGGQVRRRAVHLIRDILRRLFKVQGQQVRLQVLHDKRLYFVGVNIRGSALAGSVAVPAGIVPRDVALLICGGVADVGRAAAFTFDQAGQEILVPRFVPGVPPVIVQPGLHSLPDVRVHDRRDHAFQADDVRVRRAAGPFAEQLALLFVPGVHADVPLIRQDRVKGIFTERPPALSDGAVQVVDHIVITAAGSVPVEYLPDDRGLFRVDHIGPVDNVVTQRGDTAEEGALFGLHGHAVDRLLTGAEDFGLPHADGQQLQQKVLAVRQIAQALPGGADHGDAKIQHGLPEGEPVADVTAAAADVVNDDRVDPASPGRVEHVLEAAPVRVRAGAAFISEGGDDLNVVRRTVCAYFLELVFNAVFRLVVCAVARVCCGLHNFHFPFIVRYVTIKGHTKPFVMVRVYMSAVVVRQHRGGFFCFWEKNILPPGKGVAE